MDAHPDEIVGGLRRSAEVNCHVPYAAGRRGKQWLLAMNAPGAGCGITYEPILPREATRPAKHWMAKKDWTQRQRRRPRR